MLLVLKKEMERKMAYVTTYLDTANDNAKWYSTFAMAECAGVSAVIRTDDYSTTLQISLILLGLSLLLFILSVYRNLGIRRILNGESSKLISYLLELEARGETIPDEEAAKLLDKWRDEYTNRKHWDTVVFNSAGLLLFGLGTIFACLNFLKW